MSTNIVKDILRDGKVAVGTTCGLRDPVAQLADSGFDFILFDTQHQPIDIKQLQPQIQAMKGKRAVPIVRVGANDAALICYALDIGAKGIVIPLVNSRQEAINAVSYCKYPPDGIRSGVMSAAEFWGGPFKGFREYAETANKGILVMPQIETLEAVNHLDQILSVPGIDVALLGPLDLSVTMGMPEDYGNPKYQEALDKIVTGCRKAGVAPGSWFIPGEPDPNKFIAKGFRLFTLGWTRYLVPAIKNGLASIKR